MPLRKFNKSYYRYQVTYLIQKRGKTQEVQESEYNTDVLYHQMHFWNKKRIAQALNNIIFKSLMSSDHEITCIEVLEERFILISRYSCETY